MGAEVRTHRTSAGLAGTAGLGGAGVEGQGWSRGCCQHGQPAATLRWEMALLGHSAPQGLSPSSCSPGLPVPSRTAILSRKHRRAVPGAGSSSGSTRPFLHSVPQAQLMRQRSPWGMAPPAPGLPRAPVSPGGG